MGRSRENFHANEDTRQSHPFPKSRSRRKKNASSGENSGSTAAGQGAGEGKKALYHCNYCNKDITGKIRIKCAMCPDFDLCIECFSVGAEVTPHKSNHPYRVMDNLSFPLICPDWNADEELLLLEGIEMYGMGNWAEIAEHVATKSEDQCIQHYDNAYMSSPYFPLPDMTHVVGKNRNELLATVTEHGEGLSSFGELALKEESRYSPARIKAEDSQKNDLKLKPSRDEGPSLMTLSGYNPKRQEFDPEYDNDAERLVAEMEFKDTDTEDERKLKLQVLRIYSRRLDERQRRKDFILERNLLSPNPFEKDLSPEEKKLCRQYDVYMRLHSKEEHEELLKTVIEEHRTLKRIQELKEARAAGCRSTDEAMRYFEQKRRRDAEESARKACKNAQHGSSNQDGLRRRDAEESARKACKNAQHGSSNQGGLTPLTIMAFPGANLLSDPEKRLCCEIKLLPSDYLKMQEIITILITSGRISRKSDAYPFLNRVETSKVDRVYNMLVRKGVAPP